MKQKVQNIIEKAVQKILGADNLAVEIPSVQIERCRDKQHGDFACNIAMMLAKKMQTKPRDLAEKIIANIDPIAEIEKIDIAGPGFINITLAKTAMLSTVKTVLDQGDHYGKSQLGQGQKILVEFVSANPTGPLHVGHGRGAAFGSALSDLLASQGFTVHREYYVNDAGRQMDILAVSVWLRYLALNGAEFSFPSNGYKGDYIIDIANALNHAQHTKLVKPIEAVFAGVPEDAKEQADGKTTGDKEAHINALIVNAKRLLGDSQFEVVHGFALNAILEDIKEDLAEFGVTFQKWFSEKQVVSSGILEKGVALLKQKGLLYEKEGAWWFNATEFGDEKDRVVLRANGQHTYFATDLFYHLNKLDRGFDQFIDVFGADHHGYAPRIQAGLKALGYDVKCCLILLVQFATLYRGKVRVQMSTRSGSFVTLRELREEVGKDAARFFYVMRKADQHMDFDLELAKSKSNENPVYYIQYAYARIASVLRQLSEKNLTHHLDEGFAHLDKLETEHEQTLIAVLARYPEVLQKAALMHEPHSLCHYLRELANALHVYYNAHQILVEEDALRNARLNLLFAVRQVIYNGLTLLGVSAPEKM